MRLSLPRLNLLVTCSSNRRFIDSEADLDGTIKALLPLAQAPTLAYPELVRSGTVTLLIGLLSHENMDIVIDVVEVIHELTDEDVGNEDDDEDAEETAEEALKILIEGLVRISNRPLSLCSTIALSSAGELDFGTPCGQPSTLERNRGIGPTGGLPHIRYVPLALQGYTPTTSEQAPSKMSLDSTLSFQHNSSRKPIYYPGF